MTVFRAGFTPGNTDPAGNAEAGWVFSSDVGISVSAIGFYKGGGAPPANVRARLWRVSDTTAVSDTGTVSISGEPAGWVDIPLPAPYTVPSGQSYIPAVFVSGAGDWLFDPDDTTSPIVSPDGHITVPATGGRFLSGGSGYPSSTWVGMHGVRITYSTTAIIDVAASAATATMSASVTTTAATHQSAQGWYGLLDIYAEARAEADFQRTRRPIACPNDGEPLTSGPDGTLFCRFDGWVWDGVNES